LKTFLLQTIPKVASDWQQFAIYSLPPAKSLISSRRWIRSGTSIRLKRAGCYVDAAHHLMEDKIRAEVAFKGVYS
jgi:hypothetical protein